MQLDVAKQSIKLLPVFMLSLSLQITGNAQLPKENITALTRDFAKSYQDQDISWMGYDYQEYFRSIPDMAKIDRHIAFIQQYQQRLNTLGQHPLSKEDSEQARLLQYYLTQHQRRFELEKQFRSSGSQQIPADGFYHMEHGAEWYRFFIQVANGMDITPEAIFQYGQSEVSKIQGKIREIMVRTGYGTDTIGFRQHLDDPSFFLTNRDSVVARYEKIGTVVRAHLSNLFEQDAFQIPEIACMTWPDAGPYTPPAIYLPEAENAYGTAVFQFNFYGNRHNIRAMDWIFLHEAIPGHHFQRHATHLQPVNPLSDLFFEGAIVEGWATYVEYFGDEMGLYQDDYTWLGKWEWDLVRSARLVISTGIHHFGWTKAQAMAYWKANIIGQDDIADREITRCTNWPAQVLTYKIGAKAIFELRDAWQKRDSSRFDVKQFHNWVLERGYWPLEIVRNDE